MRHDPSPRIATSIPADGSPVASDAPVAPARPHGVSVRHFATLVLLLVLVPVFAASAMAVVPVALCGMLAEAIRRSWVAAHVRREVR
jgi:hypothetical protein